MFPMMDDAAFEALAADIKANGQREPIIVHDAAILDGRNRHRACLHVGVTPEFTDWNGIGDPITYVVSMNLHRRHLNESQRAMIAAKISNLPHGSNQFHREEVGIPTSSITAAKAAEMMNVHRGTVFDAKAVLAKADSAQIAAIEKGEAAVSTVARAIRKRERKPEPFKPSDQPTGARIVIPGGHTPEEATREGLALESDGVSPAEVPARLNIAEGSYRLMRDIVLVADRRDISAHDMKIAAAALEDMNHTRQVRRNYDTIAPIAKRLWGDGKGFSGRQAAEAARLEAFSHALGTITQVCTAGVEIEIPYLSKDRAAEAVAAIKTAEASLRRLKAKIEEIHE